MFFKTIISIVILISYIVLLPVSNIRAEEKVLLNESDIAQTLESELKALSEQVIVVDRYFVDLNMEIRDIEENLALFLTKKDESFDITFLELSVGEDIWYSHIFTQKENENLEKEDIGKKLAMLFWNEKKDQDTKITVRCFYKDKGSNVKKEYTLIREFNVRSEEKILNYLSISLSKNVEQKSENNLDLELILW